MKQYRPYNETFKFYAGKIMSLKEANEFIKYRNQFKGGHWILHIEEQFAEWLKGLKFGVTEDINNGYIYARTKPRDEKEEEFARRIEAFFSPLRRAVYPQFIAHNFVVEPAIKPEETK